MRSRGLGCFLAGAFFIAFLLVFGAGLGRPYTYWLEISDVQVFDGETSVVLFVEIERRMRYPGFLQEGSIRKPAQLLRIEVSQGREVTRIPLKFEGCPTFNTNIAPIIKLDDHFYLVEGPSRGRPSRQLHRVVGDHIETLSFEESGKLLQTAGFQYGRSRGLDNFEEYDRISNRNGWQRLNGSSYGFKHDTPIESHRHRLRLLYTEDERSQSLVADSIYWPNYWSNTLYRVNTMRWRSHQLPLK